MGPLEGSRFVWHMDPEAWKKTKPKFQRKFNAAISQDAKTIESVQPSQASKNAVLVIALWGLVPGTQLLYSIWYVVNSVVYITIISEYLYHLIIT